MKKICVVHGVGYEQKANKPINEFMSKLREATDAYVFPYLWNHPGEKPKDSRKSWVFPAVRDWTQEVLMDYTYVIMKLTGDAKEYAFQLPNADMYVGHSAGSIIVSTRSNKPLVLFGSPVQLVNNVGESYPILAERIKCGRTDNTNILNIMHFRDPIAAPLDDAVNKIVYHPYFYSLANFAAAHTSYWTNKDVLKSTVEWFNEKCVGMNGELERIKYLAKSKTTPLSLL